MVMLLNRSIARLLINMLVVLNMLRDMSITIDIKMYLLWWVMSIRDI